MNYFKKISKLLSAALLTFLFIGCNNMPIKKIIQNPTTIIQKNDSIDLKNWHFNDIELDTIPGISLKRAYDSLLIDKKGIDVIVAVIDTEIDINHTDLKNSIWKNQKEISRNQLDDDNNGYIDDVNGWNFIGNNNRENNLYLNFEFTRILRELKPYFEKIDTLNISKEDIKKYNIYKTALKKYNENLAYYQDVKDSNINLYNKYFEAKEIIKKFVINEDYSVENIEKIKSASKDDKVQKACGLLISLTNYGIDDKYVNFKKDHYTKIVDYLLGIDYNDRIIQGDDPEDIEDISYGNNKLAENLETLTHGTPMAGIITGVFKSDNIKIMPLAISAYGDEHDKDIALAIRYAVDNGAQVINMSFYKEMSMHEDWVLDAIKYANDNDVLIVSIAGNDGLDINLEEKYPNDRVDNNQEIADNFILAGASNYKIDKDFRRPYSNYGNRDVDLFAPGEYIYTTAPFNEYENDSNGTSSAGAITSGVAALIRSYYPDLTASQVKHILMDSGIEYTIEVATPTEDDPDKTTPFNELSKSGKVVNAYNALIMAERVSCGE